ncbi:MAG: hypothetical protein H7832_10405 [Magnetococcus sp. DMHC-6]
MNRFYICRTLFIVCFVLPSWLYAATEEISSPPVLAPMQVEEASLSGRRVIGEMFPLTIGQVDQLLKGGAAQLAVVLAEQAMQRGGAPLQAERWLFVWAEALLRLERFSEAKTLLERLMASDGERRLPTLSFFMGKTLAGEGQWSQARDQFSRFMTLFPNHPDRSKALLGIALCSLEMGVLREASLQFELYSNEVDTIRPDPLWLQGMIKLAAAKGELSEVAIYEKRLIELEKKLPENFWDRVALRRALIEMYGWRGDWAAAIAQSELLLAQGGGVPARRLHARLYKQWLENGPIGYRLEKTKPQIVQIRARYQNLDQLHMVWEEEPALRDDLLKELLNQELAHPIGLLLEEGLLTPEGMGLEGSLPESVRILYANAYGELGRMEEAWKMLEGVSPGEAAIAARLGLLVHTAYAKEGNSSRLEEIFNWLSDWLPRHAQRLLCGDLGKALVAFLFVATEHGDAVMVEQVRSLLENIPELPTEVERMLRFHQAWVLEQGGELETALVIYLSLVDDADKIHPLDALLPMDPRMAVVRVLRAQGRWDDLSGLGWKETK